MFNPFVSKPITRMAHKVTEDCAITPLAEEATSCIYIDGVDVSFKHYERVNVGDYIVKLDDTDIYHCSAKIFEERNIVD